MTWLGTAAWIAGLGAAALPFALELTRKPMTDRARRQAPGDFAPLSMGMTHFDWIGPKTGPVVVCVHGLTSPSFVFLGLARHLVEQGYRVLVYDLYGRGYSDRPRAPQTPAFFGTQLTELLAHEGIEDDITLIGYSMGGVIASAFAAENDHRLRRLILLAPAGMGHELGPMARWATEWPLIGDWVFHLGFPRYHRRGTEAERDQPSSVDNITELQLNELHYRGFVRAVLASLRGTLRKLQEADHRRIAQTRLPVVAIWGRHDTVIPLRAMGQLAQWNRDVRHHVIEDAGHGLTHTHSAEVAQAIRDTWEGPVVPPAPSRS